MNRHRHRHPRLIALVLLMLASTAVCTSACDGDEKRTEARAASNAPPPGVDDPDGPPRTLQTGAQTGATSPSHVLAQPRRTAPRAPAISADAPVPGTFRVAMLQSIEELDPSFVDLVGEAQVGLQIHEGLLRFPTSSTRPEPGLATSYRASVDGRTWTFELRPGLTWSNGDALTAHDFVASYRRAVSAQTRSPISWLYTDIARIEGARAVRQGDAQPSTLGVRAIDDHRLELRLERSVAILPWLLSFPAFAPVHASQRNAWSAGVETIGAGPFVIADYTGGSMTLEPNSRYHTRSLVQPRRIELTWPTTQGALDGYDAGRYDIVEVDTLDDALAPDGTLPPDLLVDPVLSLLYLAFDTSRPPFDDPEVRRLVAHAALQGDITRQPSSLTRALGFVSPVSFPGWPRHTPPPLRAVPELAKAIAERVPLSERRIRVAESYRANDTRLVEVLEALGFEVSLRDGAPNARVQSWFADYPDPSAILSVWSSEAQRTRMGHSDPRVDELVQQGVETDDFEARLEVLVELERHLMATWPAVPLGHGRFLHLVRPEVEGLSPNALGLHAWSVLRRR